MFQLSTTEMENSKLNFARIFYLKRFSLKKKQQQHPSKTRKNIQEVVCPAGIQVLDLMNAIQIRTTYNWGFHFFSIFHHLSMPLFW